MRLLRKTGVRQPWQPSPLQGNSDPLRPTLVTSGVQPWPVGQVIIVGWQARPPNADPLRPAAVIADPPDATLVQPQAQFVGRLPRSEDPGHARPASVIGAAQPIPGAVVASGLAPRDQVIVQPDRLALTAVQTGAQPVPGARTHATFAPRDQVIAPPDRLAPTTVIGTTATPFGAVAVATGRPLMADRVGVAPIVIGASGAPAAGQTLWSARPREDDRPGRAPVVVGAVAPFPGATVRVVGYPFRASRESGRAPIVVSGETRWPASQGLFSRAPFGTPGAAYTLGTIRGPGPSGSILGPEATGDVESPHGDGRVLSPLTAGQARSPKAYGTIKG